MAEEPTRPKPPRTTSGPRLLIVGAGRMDARALTTDHPLTVGRGEAADVTVDDPELSRLHAQLRWDGVLHVCDLGSSNGTLVRGVAVSPQTWVAVGPGETIEIGGTTLMLEQREGPPLGPTMARGPLTMTEVLHVADKVAASDISVLLLGETGVGKGVLARRLHEHSSRRGARFLELNCAALPETLLEGELFGHERGAFTGASTTKPGLIEVADGGTVFLDEVGELPGSVQSKLLRVIEERQVMRLGGRDPRNTDVRFVAATNRDLSVEVAQGRFRSDLYYRLNGITLFIPPLRERRDEVIPLAESFVAEATRKAGTARRLSPAVRGFLLEHPWPGNVRELKNVVERAVVLADDEEIRLEHLFVGGRPRSAAPMAPVEAGLMGSVPGAAPTGAAVGPA
ncbi:MAG: sigma 54-interacting transcriptional regulator, partial [Deltaproteobacteria bacterium]|nr:sigma 54-interacting transcriptional regulator [Deltaproteobacteria bacterium]